MYNKATLAELGLTTLSGLILRNTKPLWPGQPARAEATQAQFPDWSEMHVLVFCSEDALVKDGFSQFDLSTLDAKVQLKYASNSTTAQAFTYGWAFNVVIVDQSALSSIAPDWAKVQRQAGAAFVGVNIEPAELGELIGIPHFARHFIYTLAEPSLTVARFWASGNPVHIQALEERGNLYSFEGEYLMTGSGFRDVCVGYLIGYIPAHSDCLAMVFNDIRGSFAYPIN